MDLSKGHESYKEAVHIFGSIAMERIIRPWLHNDLFFRLTPLSRLQKNAVKVLHEFSTSVIEDRKKMFSGNEISYSGRKRLAMLDLMLKAKNDGADINDEGIREEVDTFMFEVRYPMQDQLSS